MIGSGLEGGAGACPQCGYFAAATNDRLPAMQCPLCERKIADATGGLSRIGITPRIIELIPESVARENYVVPYDEVDGVLIVLSDIRQLCLDTAEKLRFILNRKITCVHASAESIRAAIDRHYGPS